VYLFALDEILARRDGEGIQRIVKRPVGLRGTLVVQHVRHGNLIMNYVIINIIIMINTNNIAVVVVVVVVVIVVVVVVVVIVIVVARAIVILSWLYHRRGFVPVFGNAENTSQDNLMCTYVHGDEHLTGNQPAGPRKSPPKSTR
jgi:hypothetical protein